MRDDARRPTPHATPTARRPTSTHPDAAAAVERRLDVRLTAAADAIAGSLRPVAVDWPADHFASLVYAAALVELKATLPSAAFATLQQHYRAHRPAFLARLQPAAAPRAD